MLLIPGVALLSIFAPSAIRLFSGSEYLVAREALGIIAFGMGFLTIFYILAFVLKGVGENLISMKIALLGGITNSVLNFFLINQWGLRGAAIATSLTSLLVMILAIYFARKKLGSFLPGLDLIKYLLATGVISLLASSLPPGKFLFLIWTIFLMGGYFILLWMLRAFNQKDWQYLKNAFLKKKY
jgi:stage V sporulation protein B